MSQQQSQPTPENIIEIRSEGSVHDEVKNIQQPLSGAKFAGLVNDFVVNDGVKKGPFHKQTAYFAKL